MKVPFLDLSAQYHAIREQVDPAITEIVTTSAFVLGPAVKKFEKAFAEYCDSKHCIGVSSGTSALSLLMQAHGIGPGDEVITAANSFFASAEAISVIGATPVLVDVLKETATMNSDLLEQAITPHTKAILPVHLYGQPAAMDPIKEIARKHHLVVLEDAAQAHGARYKGARTGNLADGAAFSCYPGKNLGAYGDAGMVTTDDDGIALTVRMLRDHGMKEKYHHELIGWNERMDGIQGAVLAIKLQHLDDWNAKRRDHAELYCSELDNVGDIRMFQTPPECESVFHLFVIRTEQRDALQNHLKEKEIGTGIHYPIPIHLQKAAASYGYAACDFPVTEQLSDEILSLPMYPELTQEQILYVCDTIKIFFDASR